MNFYMLNSVKFRARVSNQMTTTEYKVPTSGKIKMMENIQTKFLQQIVKFFIKKLFSSKI